MPVIFENCEKELNVNFYFYSVRILMKWGLYDEL